MASKCCIYVICVFVIVDFFSLYAQYRSVNFNTCTRFGCRIECWSVVVCDCGLMQKFKSYPQNAMCIHFHNSNSQHSAYHHCHTYTTVNQIGKKVVAFTSDISCVCMCSIWFVSGNVDKSGHSPIQSYNRKHHLHIFQSHFHGFYITVCWCCSQQI